MAMLPSRIRGSRTLLSAVMIPCVSVVLFTAGCTAPRHYAARKLPSQYAAPPVENVQRIDLSRLANISASSELIDRGDVLGVTISTDYAGLARTTTPVRVGEDGQAEIPPVGKVKLAGLEIEEAVQVIAAAAVHRGVFRNPHVTVNMMRPRTNRIFVIGAVKNTGVVKLRPNASSLLAALVEAGGLTEDAGPEVEIRRAGPPRAAPGLLDPAGPRVASTVANSTAGTEASNAASNAAKFASFNTPPAQEPQIIRVNLTEAAKAGDRRYCLRDGDVVMASKQVLKPIHIIGMVRKPDKYELPPNQEIRVLDALAMAGDRTMSIADRVLIIRQIPGQEEPIRIDVSIREAKNHGDANVRLAPGDIVSVEETPATIVLGTLQRVVRVAVGGSVGLF
jgi:polysaccharide export outer membrane protein